MNFTMLLLSLLPLLLSVEGQSSVPGSYDCATNAPISTLSACDVLAPSFSSCFANPTATASILSCFCQQQMLDNIIDCESEYRLCYQSNEFDSLAEDIHSSWDAYCRTYVTFTPTTPALSMAATTVPTLAGGDMPAFCTEFDTSCAILSSSEAACLNLDPSATASSFTQCACSTNLLSLASVCLYDGNMTCLGQSAALSNIPLFNFCGVTYSKGNLISTNSAGNLTTTSAFSASAGSMASTTPVSSTSTTMRSSQSSASMSNSALSSAASSASSSRTFDGVLRDRSWHTALLISMIVVVI